MKQFYVKIDYFCLFYIYYTAFYLIFMQQLIYLTLLPHLKFFGRFWVKINVSRETILRETTTKAFKIYIVDYSV